MAGSIFFNAVSQPGPYDGGTSRDRIGTLYRYLPLHRSSEQPDCPVAAGLLKTGNGLIQAIRPNYEMKLVKYTRQSNQVDAAVARPVSPDVISDNVLEIGTVKGVAAAESGMKIQKSGRSSGVTEGKVTATGVSLKVELGEEEYGWFSDQVVSDAVVNPGDSGSLALDLERQAVGLIFAGSDKYSIFNPIQNVLDGLQVTF